MCLLIIHVPGGFLYIVPVILLLLNRQWKLIEHIKLFQGSILNVILLGIGD